MSSRNPDKRVFTDWDGVMAELFDIDDIQPFDNPHGDSSSGVGSDLTNPVCYSPPRMATRSPCKTPPGGESSSKRRPPYHQQSARFTSAGNDASVDYVDNDVDEDEIPAPKYPIEAKIFYTSSPVSPMNDTPSDYSSGNLSSVSNKEYEGLQQQRSVKPSKKKQIRFSSFDFLPDDIILGIFSNLPTEQVCRCARVCRRWYGLAWDPTLWTSIRVNDSSVDINKALKVLTHRLSYDTPFVCVNIHRINLNGCSKLSDKGLQVIANRCPEITHLDLLGCANITNMAIFEVVSKCTNLEHLNLLGCSSITCISLTPEASMQASPLRSKQIFLRYLDMSDCVDLEDGGLSIIASHCTQLCYLYLRRCTRVSDIGVQYIANYCTMLRELSLSDCRRITDFGLRELSKLETSLRYLSIAKCDKISDVGVRYIAKFCYKLRYLNCRGCEAVSDDSIVQLAHSCRRLRSLDVGKCDVTDDGLQILGDFCVQLKKLSLKSCDGITDRGVIMLANSCPGLQQLNVQDCHISVEAYRAVKRFCKRCIIEHTNPGFY
ncbi:uncharacterized protein LOC141906806 [Tubulanus polymorphus]|uniref:uncharacterized protein LOC141906806 n=1 Tax=Tubulanus polymorphus TaxID=672921 RepID=UPI003DA232D3